MTYVILGFFEIFNLIFLSKQYYYLKYYNKSVEELSWYIVLNIDKSKKKRKLKSFDI